MREKRNPLEFIIKSRGRQEKKIALGEINRFFYGVDFSDLKKRGLLLSLQIGCSNGESIVGVRRYDDILLKYIHEERIGDFSTEIRRYLGLPKEKLKDGDTVIFTKPNLYRIIDSQGNSFGEIYSYAASLADKYPSKYFNEFDPSEWRFMPSSYSITVGVVNNAKLFLRNTPDYLNGPFPSRIVRINESDCFIIDSVIGMEGSTTRTKEQNSFVLEASRQLLTRFPPRLFTLLRAGVSRAQPGRRQLSGNLVHSNI